MTRFIFILTCFLYGIHLNAQTWEVIPGFTALGPGEVFIHDLVVVEDELVLIGEFLNTLEENVMCRILDANFADHNTYAYHPTGWIAEAGVVYDNRFLLGGEFLNINNSTDLDNIAVLPLDSNTYVAVQFECDRVWDFVEFQDELIIAGIFPLDDFGGTGVSRVAAYSDGNINMFGSPIGFDVTDLEVFQDKLIMGGLVSAFSPTNSTDDLIACANLAIYDGTEWSCPQGGVNGRVHALCADEENGQLYVAGNFSLVAGGALETARVAAWDGTAWSEIGGGLQSGQVNSMVLYHGQLYAGGSNLLDGHDLIYFNGQEWSALVGEDQITDGKVNKLLVHEGDLIAAGQFINIGGLETQGLVKYHLDEEDVFASVGEMESQGYSGVQAFPNPAQSFVDLEVPFELMGTQCVVFDALGKEVVRLILERTVTRVDVGKWDAGVYFVWCGEERLSFVKE